jgi:hypothetical protein
LQPKNMLVKSIPEEVFKSGIVFKLLQSVNMLVKTVPNEVLFLASGNT